jgi:hypothetical protein
VNRAPVEIASFAVALAAGVVVSLAGCGAAPSPTRPGSAAASASAAPAPPADPIAAAAPSSFKTYSSARFDLALPLPDGAAFRVDDKTDRWLVATHEATGSTLRVRVWREDDVGGRARCEERARGFRALPSREGSRLVEARRIAVPPEHDTIAEVRVMPLVRAQNESKNAPVEGFVIAFGGWAKKCFAFVFTTRADDERIVAARLATIVDGSLARTRVESELLPSRQPHDAPR